MIYHLLAWIVWNLHVVLIKKNLKGCIYFIYFNHQCRLLHFLKWTKAYSIYIFLDVWLFLLKIPFIFKSSPLQPFQWVFLWSWLTYRMTSWASNCYGGLGMTRTPTSMTVITGSPGPATTSILLSPREWPLSSMESINCLLKTRISFRVQGKVVTLCKIPS